MKFHTTSLKDAVLIEPRKIGDARGYFARTFCMETFAGQGLETTFAQHNISHSAKTGTVRGMHFQRPPYGEVKVVRVVKGAIHDVIVDIRKDSPTFGKWAGFDLTEENGHALYVPKGFAHGFQTLRPETTMVYLNSHPYTPEAEGGLRHDDPAIGIEWPLEVTTVSEKDSNWPDFDPASGGPL